MVPLYGIYMTMKIFVLHGKALRFICGVPNITHNSYYFVIWVCSIVLTIKGLRAF